MPFWIKDKRVTNISSSRGWCSIYEEPSLWGLLSQKARLTYCGFTPDPQSPPVCPVIEQQIWYPLYSSEFRNETVLRKMLGLRVKYWNMEAAQGNGNKPLFRNIRSQEGLSGWEPLSVPWEVSQLLPFLHNFWHKPPTKRVCSFCSHRLETHP